MTEDGESAILIVGRTDGSSRQVCLVCDQNRQLDIRVQRVPHSTASATENVANQAWCANNEAKRDRMADHDGALMGQDTHIAHIITVVRIIIIIIVVIVFVIAILSMAIITLAIAISIMIIVILMVSLLWYLY